MGHFRRATRPWQPSFQKRKMGEKMKFPLTGPSKLLWYPYKWMWQHCRGLRFPFYAIIASMPLFLTVDSMLNSPGAVEHWKHKRQARIDHMLAWQETPSLESSH